MRYQIDRRAIVSGLGVAAAGLFMRRPLSGAGVSAPAMPVAISRCRTYGSELLPTLEKLFDQIGGLGRLVKGKTIGVKLNLNLGPTNRQGHYPLGESHWPHPMLIAGMMHCMAKAGANRIRLLESAWAPRADPLEETLIEANWDLQLFLGAAPRVEFENTNFLGSGKKYSRFPVPGGGLLFPAYDLNHSYEDCDVFVSIAKPKDHSTTGVTLCMKNLFGMTPVTIYGSGAGIDEPSELPSGWRVPMLHNGERQPPKSSPPEIDPQSPRNDGYRIPRAIADLCAARPVHLAVLDGISTMAGGQNPGMFGVEVVRPGLLAVGTNVVNTAAVGVALMNYDPMADRGMVPFETCDNKLRLAEELGVGTRDLGRIEVIGPPIRELVFDFKALRAKREIRRKAEQIRSRAGERA
jgi:uncharacterized protein (DUF362 family)